MKTSVKLLVSSVLVLTLLFSSLSTVMADSADTPTVTPVSGDTTFTTKTVSVEALPGAIALGEMTVPVGFPSGEAQFGGNGVMVSGMSYGKATVCSFIKTVEIQQGWGGKIAEWTGEKWDKLDTTISVPEEGTLATACATITGSGTYAFIKYVVDPSLLPKMAASVCNFVFSGYFEPDNRSYGATNFNVDGPNTFHMLFFNPDFPIGIPVNYSIFDVIPSGTITTGLTGSAITESVNINGDAAVFFTTVITYTDYSNYTVRLNFPTLGCYQDLDFPWGDYYHEDD